MKKNIIILLLIIFALTSCDIIKKDEIDQVEITSVLPNPANVFDIITIKVLNLKTKDISITINGVPLPIIKDSLPYIKVVIPLLNNYGYNELILDYGSDRTAKYYITINEPPKSEMTSQQTAELLSETINNISFVINQGLNELFTLKGDNSNFDWIIIWNQYLKSSISNLNPIDAFFIESLLKKYHLDENLQKLVSEISKNALNSIDWQSFYMQQDAIHGIITNINGIIDIGILTAYVSMRFDVAKTLSVFHTILSLYQQFIEVIIPIQLWEIKVEPIDNSNILEKDKNYELIFTGKFKTTKSLEYGILESFISASFSWVNNKISPINDPNAKKLIVTWVLEHALQSGIKKDQPLPAKTYSTIFPTEVRLDISRYDNPGLNYFGGLIGSQSFIDMMQILFSGLQISEHKSIKIYDGSILDYNPTTQILNPNKIGVTILEIDPIGWQIVALSWETWPVYWYGELWSRGLIIEVVDKITTNSPPSKPFNPNPYDGEINISINPTLSWLCSDPENDLLKYDVYLGPLTNPPLVSHDQLITIYSANLNFDQKYYWKIVAIDNQNNKTIGDIWSFTTISDTSNQSPNEPTNPYPNNGATNIALNTNLTWECIDPENDPILYDVYFGTTTNPPIAYTDLTENQFTPNLNYNTTYYWKINSKDNHGNITNGAIWNFTTEKNIGENYPPNMPHLIYPVQGAEYVCIGTELTWTCTDPDNDPLTFDIYFGTLETFSKVKTGISAFSYKPDLQTSTHYYWKIIAKDDHGHETESETYLFLTSSYGDINQTSTFTDPRDGKEYATIQIGDQWWMAQNLNFDVYDSYCYNNSNINCQEFGKLYNWQTAITVCPEGWHLPTDKEWSEMESQIGMDFYDAYINVGFMRGIPQGRELKDGGCVGFNAKLGGQRSSSGNYVQINEYGTYWTITEDETDNNYAWVRMFNVDHPGAGRGVAAKTLYLSIRCLKGEGSIIFNFPQVQTSSITSYTSNSAVCGGNVTSDGGTNVTARGVCWSTSQNPTLESNLGKTIDGSGTGNYTSSITGLNCGTTYYVRAYATNSIGTAYGNQLSLTTLQCEDNLATVSTSSISNVTQTSATSGGNITSDGGTSVTARGICWSTSQNPTLENNLGKTIDGGGTGNYTSSITGLNCGTTYYVRAYATNSKGTAYGNQYNFTTSPCNMPTVSTSSVSNITYTLANSGGNVTSDGGTNVTARGICWSTFQNPTLENNLGKTIDGSGTGNYTSSITGLNCGITYYVRAYATNSIGTAYGSQISFATLYCDLPTISTNSVGNITQNSAICGGDVISDGGTSVYERGICWSTSQNPTLENNIGRTIVGSGLGSYTGSITGLSCGTTYYVRAYAINDIGTSYGNNVSFKTHNACDEITSINYYGQIYNIIPIGNQCWMGENLNVGTLSGLSQTDNGIIEKACYSNQESKCDNYGGLYMWNELMNYGTGEGANGICPEGWHVPTDNEWKVLEIYLGMTETEANLTGQRGTDQGTQLLVNGSSGFEAILAGWIDRSYFGENEATTFWTSSQLNSSEVWIRRLAPTFNGKVVRITYNIQGSYDGYFSVRCIKD
ncbi:MAG: hypothetical protein AMS27_07615 [Bacteroides sp. SM23_62_1]|nr:MAG: hypothetical protein AMS27_07615 [Bacteroides sp. SM23_62_1]